MNFIKTISFIIFILIFIFNLPVCSKSNNKDSGVTKYYFPANTFSERNDLDTFIQDWYGTHLDVLDTENLILINNRNVIRFTCLRTFHRPFSIKVVWDNVNVNVKLYFNMSDGAGGYGAGKLIHHQEKEINNIQLNGLLNILNKDNIFNQPAIIDDSGLDGSQWIIEINIDGNYKVLDRWTPERGAVYDIGKYLIELSGEDITNLY